jgi:hypothetical protein
MSRHHLAPAMPVQKIVDRAVAGRMPDRLTEAANRTRRRSTPHAGRRRVGRSRCLRRLIERDAVAPLTLDAAGSGARAALNVDRHCVISRAPLSQFPSSPLDTFTDIRAGVIYRTVSIGPPELFFSADAAQLGAG